MSIFHGNLAWLLAAGGALGIATVAVRTGGAADSTAPGAPTAAAANNTTAADPLGGLKSVLVKSSGPAPSGAQAGESAPLVPVPRRTTDPNVRPASATEPAATYSVLAPAAGQPGVATAAATSDTALAAAQAAADLLSTALVAPKTDELAGRTVTLLQAMAPATGDRGRQLVIARAYWKLSAAQADCNWSADSVARLDQLAAGRTPAEASLLATARAAALARLAEARVEGVVAQQELADWLAAPATSALPLTSDLPLVGAYRTYFEILFAQRAPPARLRLIDRTLPLRRDVIETRTVAVQAALSTVHHAEDARAKGTGEMQSVLICHAELARQRHDFLTAVRDYNLDVAEYALTVADPALPNDRLVGMLIPLKTPSPTAAVEKELPGARPPDNDPLLQPALPARTTGPGERRGERTAPKGDAAAPAGVSPSPFSGSTPPEAARTTPYGAGAPVAPVNGGPTAPDGKSVPLLPLNSPVPAAGGSNSAPDASRPPFGNGR